MNKEWTDIANGVFNVVNALAPVIGMAAPELSPALALAQKIAQGVLAAEPTAVALYNQIKSGTPPTPDQLQKYAADYEASYQRLDASIKAKLAQLGQIGA